MPKLLDSVKPIIGEYIIDKYVIVSFYKERMPLDPDYYKGAVLQVYYGKVVDVLVEKDKFEDVECSKNCENLDNSLAIRGKIQIVDHSKYDIGEYINGYRITLDTIFFDSLEKAKKG